MEKDNYYFKSVYEKLSTTLADVVPDKGIINDLSTLAARTIEYTIITHGYCIKQNSEMSMRVITTFHEKEGLIPIYTDDGYTVLKVISNPFLYMKDGIEYSIYDTITIIFNEEKEEYVTYIDFIYTNMTDDNVQMN